MSNWDLMMPGMGLTAIGLAGLTLSYAEIAHTFIDGLHALTGLTMFIGMIFLAVGILDGGISTSNKAKATVLVIISIALGFGMYAFTLNTSNYTVTLAGILLAIAFPAILIAYLSMKHPTYLKPIGSIVGIAGAAGIIAWLAFGFVGPDQYMIPQAEVQDAENIEVASSEPEIDPAAPIYEIEILKDSFIPDNPDYEPDLAEVSQGHIIRWTNSDAILHSATSQEGYGDLFDTGLLGEGESFSLDTSELEPGEYEYLCSIHPQMRSTLVIRIDGSQDAMGGSMGEMSEGMMETSMMGEGKGSMGEMDKGMMGEDIEDSTMTDGVTEDGITRILMPTPSPDINGGLAYYEPDTADIKAGGTVIWENVDFAIHTVTSGSPQTEHDGIFDSELVSSGEEFSYTFDKPGSYEYYCFVHPWMTGTINVE